jgi:hypothetical protein
LGCAIVSPAAVSESRRRRNMSPSSVLDPHSSVEPVEVEARASPVLEALFAAALAGGRGVRSDALFPVGGGR